MLSTTDDLRISELKELSTPQEVMGEIPRTLTATRVVMAARNAIHAILDGTDDRLLVVVGPCSVHDPVAAVEYAERLAALARTACRPPRDRDARLFREAAHDGRLEGADQRSRSRRQLSTSTRACGSRATCCSTVNNLGLPAGMRVPRHDDAAIHRRPGGVGARSARAPPRARSIASSRRGCPARSASRTAPTAMCASQPMR